MRRDFTALHRYANDLIDEDTFVMLSGKPLSEAEEREYFRDSLKKVVTGKKIHLVVYVDDVFAGSCEVRMFDRRKGHVGEIGISLARDYRNEGIGTECLKVLIDQAEKRGLRLLYLHVFENNQRAIHLYRKLGFQDAGTVPGMYSYKGSYIGETVMYLPVGSQRKG
jgi:RimJ/RimL family protein N-acetyltransferase